jgi:hypothetical protein
MASQIASDELPMGAPWVSLMASLIPSDVFSDSFRRFLGLPPMACLIRSTGASRPVKRFQDSLHVRPRSATARPPPSRAPRRTCYRWVRCSGSEVKSG